MVYIVIGWSLISAAVLCAYIASEKNRGGMGWFFAGLVFNIYAVIAIVAVPALSEDEKKQREVRNDLDAALLEEEEWKQKMKQKL